MGDAEVLLAMFQLKWEIEVSRMIDPKKYFHFSQNGNTSFYDLLIEKELPYFNGHFPENPVLPGVAMIDASVLAVEKKINQSPLFIKKVKSAKFMDLVKPGDLVTIEVVESSKQSFTLNWNKTENNTLKKAAEIILEF